MNEALIAWLIGLIIFLIAVYTKPSKPEIAKLAFAAFCIGLFVWLLTGAKVTL